MCGVLHILIYYSTLTLVKTKKITLYNTWYTITCVQQSLLDYTIPSFSSILLQFLTNHSTPLIVRKSDGGFLYATTDLAAVQHRVQTEQADQIIYVTGRYFTFHSLIIMLYIILYLYLCPYCRCWPGRPL